MPSLPDSVLPLFGPIALVLLLGLGAGLLLLRLREHLVERPDPKVNYATRGELEKLRLRIEDLQRENKADLNRHILATDKRQRDLDHRLTNEMTAAHKLIHRNAEHIATLLAQFQGANQRLSELTIKSDKLLERSLPRHSD